MRYIRKGPEPPELTAFKQAKTDDWKPRYDNLSPVEKDAIWRGLWQEQGGLCCYCGGPIGRHKQPTDCHIDHVCPQSVRVDLELEYSNMLGSCQGREPDRFRWPPPAPEDCRHPPASEHCGHKRDNWFDEALFVTPLRPDCESYFCFGSSGEISATRDPAKFDAASETIKRLGLEIPRLQAARKAAIEPLLAGPEEMSVDELRKLYDSLDQPDARGRLQPYCFAIRAVLRLYVPGL